MSPLISKWNTDYKNNILTGTVFEKEINTMKDKYYDQAVACVKDYVLPAQLNLYQSCDGDLDRVYGEAMNGNGYFGKVII